MIASAKARVVRAFLERADKMLDSVTDMPKDDVATSAQKNCRYASQKPKLHYLLAQSDDPDSTEFLEKLDRAADDLWRKSNT
jgi:hypothetical protein